MSLVSYLEEKGMIWKKFFLKDLFNVKKVTGKPLNQYDDGAIPYVSSSNENNGVISYVSAGNTSVSIGNCLSIDPIKGTVFYQPNNFVGRGFSGASINLLYNDNLNESNAVYIASIITRASKEIAAYDNLLTGEKLNNLEIAIPTNVLGNPNWTYMENCINKVFNKKLQLMKDLKTIINKKAE